jgi:hypothetical protein
MPRLAFEVLEARENPTGPALVDPTGIAVTTPQPGNVEATAPAPAPTGSVSEAEAVQRAIQDALATLSKAW